MTKTELLKQLGNFSREELEVALRAAEAAKHSQHDGTYFLHHFLQEERSEENGSTLVSLPVTELIMNPGKMVHGGITALLCDNAMGMASYLKQQRSGVTLDLSVRYHKPGRGERLIATGEVVAAGSLINSTRCEVRDEHGTLVASATGSFYHRK